MPEGFSLKRPTCLYRPFFPDWLRCSHTALWSAPFKTLWRDWIWIGNTNRCTYRVLHLASSRDITLWNYISIGECSSRSQCCQSYLAAILKPCLQPDATDRLISGAITNTSSTNIPSVCKHTPLQSPISASVMTNASWFPQVQKIKWSSYGEFDTAAKYAVLSPCLKVMNSSTFGLTTASLSENSLSVCSPTSFFQICTIKTFMSTVSNMKAWENYSRLLFTIGRIAIVASILIYVWILFSEYKPSTKLTL